MLDGKGWNEIEKNIQLSSKFKCVISYENFETFNYINRK